MTTKIRILEKIIPPLVWEPQPGEQTNAFIERKLKEPRAPSREELETGANSVLHEAHRILGRCLPPPPRCEMGAETGLVVGNVQSGKTLSFTTVSCLARDNKFGMVIVIAGTKNNLLIQTHGRLSRDLGLVDAGAAWRQFLNPTSNDASRVQDCLDALKKERFDNQKKAPLITLLKQQDHLDNLAKLLSQLRLSGVPVLIIDDEGDQASLNTRAAKNRRLGTDEKSTIYEKLCAIRNCLKHHTYLQYTATPQANLLLAAADLFNPNFAEPITAGSEYTGGSEFFSANSKVAVDIPLRDIPPKRGPYPSAPPASLVSAVKFFLLVASEHALSEGKGKERNRSMLVHPSQPTDPHAQYEKWVSKIKNTLKGTISKNINKNPGLLIDLFKNEFKSLRKTSAGIPDLPILLKKLDDHVFDEMVVAQVNSTDDAEKQIKWEAYSYWILIGGQKLDRGYTVEGLAITYMPRTTVGANNADTLQQRARFFGYKKSYLGLCRVFLPASVREDFERYVEHERQVRGVLEKHRGRPLREWRRAILLDESLRPTRRNVIGINTKNVKLSRWLHPEVLHGDEKSVHANRELFESILRLWISEFGQEDANVVDPERYLDRTGGKPNTIVPGVPLKRVIDEFLLKVEIKDILDVENHGYLLSGLAVMLDSNADLKVDVFLVGGLKEVQKRARKKGRGKEASDRLAPIDNPASGRSKNYIGDDGLHSVDNISLRLHTFDIRPPGSVPDIENVPWFSIYIPKALKKNLVVEG